MSDYIEVTNYVEFMDSTLPAFLKAEYGWDKDSPEALKAEDSWGKLNDVMLDVPGWCLAITNDSIKMPHWTPQHDTVVFITVDEKDNGANRFDLFLDGPVYGTNCAADIPELIYAFNLVQW